MRILLVGHSFPQFADDMAGHFLYSLSQRQCARGHDVRAVVPHAPTLAERDVLGDVSIVRYRYGPESSETLAYAGTLADQALRSWRARVRLARLVAAARGAVREELRRFRPDVVHCHWWFPNALATMGHAGAPPVVLTSHGTDLFLLDRFRSARPLAGALFRAAARVTVVSSPLVPRVAALGVAPERVRVIPMPLDQPSVGTPHSEPSPPPDAATDSRRDPAHLLFVGRLVERKGAAYALDALAALRQRGHDTTLTIVGDGPERPMLEARAAALGIEGVVRFTGGLPRPAVEALYRRATLLLAPSITDWKGEQEGFGMVIVEALRAGLPVVAFSSGGIPDIIVHGESGVLAREADAGALADAAVRVLDQPETRAALVRGGMRRLERYFAPDAIVDAFDDVYAAAREDRMAVGQAGHCPPPMMRKAM